MRKKNLFKNVKTSLVFYFINIIFSFVLRIVFIKTLSADHLGLNGLFSNILTVLSFAELGIGSAIIYSLYKPLANDDEENIRMYMNIYKKAYRIIGVFIFSIGLLLIPFLSYFIAGDYSFININLIYVLFLLGSASSYFFSYNQNLLTADQKIDVVKKYVETGKLVIILFQGIVLLILKNYILYLIINILITFITNYILYRKTIKIYPFLNSDKPVKKISKEERTTLVKNIKALVMHKFGDILVNCVDNIVISAYLGLVFVGVYSNYLMIVNAITSIISLIINSIRSAVGNFISIESHKKIMDMFNELNLLLYIMYSFCSVCFLNLLNPFIGNIWLRDSSYLFSNFVVFIIAFNFLVKGLRATTLMFRNVYGLFVYDRYKPIFEGIVNLVLSIYFVQFFGVAGVLVATVITNLCINLFIEPFVVYKYAFNESVIKFYFDALYKIFTTCVMFSASIYVVNKIPGNGIINFVIIGMVSVIIWAICILIFYYPKKEFKNLINRAINKKLV